MKIVDTLPHPPSSTVIIVKMPVDIWSGFEIKLGFRDTTCIFFLLHVFHRQIKIFSLINSNHSKKNRQFQSTCATEEEPNEEMIVNNIRLRVSGSVSMKQAESDGIEKYRWLIKTNWSGIRNIVAITLRIIVMTYQFSPF